MPVKAAPHKPVNFTVMVFVCLTKGNACTNCLCQRTQLSVKTICHAKPLHNVHYGLSYFEVVARRAYCSGCTTTFSSTVRNVQKFYSYPYQVLSSMASVY